MFCVCEFELNNSDYKLIDEHKPSRIVSLMKEDFDGRVMKF